MNAAMDPLTAIDSNGRDGTDAAREYTPGAVNASGTPAYIGRLRHSARRWSWVVRFDGVAHDLDDGCRWEPVSDL